MYNEIQVQYTRTLLFYNDYNLLTLFYPIEAVDFHRLIIGVHFATVVVVGFFVYSEPLLSSFRFKVTKYTQTTLLRSIYFLCA